MFPADWSPVITNPPINNLSQLCPPAFNTSQPSHQPLHLLPSPPLPSLPGSVLHCRSRCWRVGGCKVSPFFQFIFMTSMAQQPKNSIMHGSVSAGTPLGVYNRGHSVYFTECTFDIYCIAEFHTAQEKKKKELGKCVNFGVCPCICFTNATKQKEHANYGAV